MSNKFASIKPAHVTRWLLMLGAALVLSGCTRGMSDLRDWVAQEKADLSGFALFAGGCPR